MKFSAKEILKPTIVLFIICVVTAALLGFTNQLTAPKIAALAEQNEIAVRKLLLPEATDFEESVNDASNNVTYCLGVDADGSGIGYVFTTVSKGYGGDVKIMTGVDMKGTVTGVKTLELSETAGLGMNAQNDSFLNQYKGESGTVAVAKNSPSENEIQALTGATITSTAVTKCVNAALDYFSSQLNGGVTNG